MISPLSQRQAIKPIEWVGSSSNGYIKILDQTALPHRVKYISCRSIQTLYKAIKTLQIRGAPLIGIAAGYGIALAIQDVTSIKETILSINKASRLLISARPTAVNLRWAIERVNNAARKYAGQGVSILRVAVLGEAIAIHREDASMCEKIGEYGNKLINKNVCILTICNTGALATGGSGTAFSVILAAERSGKKPTVYACETRPLLQGARLTMWELKMAGVKSYLICDGAAATTIKNKRIDCIITGADRIARNGDTANKVGTYGLAILAKEHKIPFYVAAPCSTFDISKKTGLEIPVEERATCEITIPYGLRLAPRGVSAYNPAFDITPAKYITCFITDKSIIRPPYRENLFKLSEYSRVR